MMKNSSRLSQRKNFDPLCIHKCEGGPNDVKMLCPGDVQHNCGGYIWKLQCNKHKHRCGQGTCVCSLYGEKGKGKKL